MARSRHWSEWRKALVLLKRSPLLRPGPPLPVRTAYPAITQSRTSSWAAVPATLVCQNFTLQAEYGRFQHIRRGTHGRLDVGLDLASIRPSHSSQVSAHGLRMSGTGRHIFTRAMTAQPGASVSSDCLTSGMTSVAKGSSERSPLERYDWLVAQGTLLEDAAQRQVAEAMDNLVKEMQEHHHQMKAYQLELNEWLAERQRLRAQMIKEEVAREKQRRAEQAAREQSRSFFSRWLFRSRRRNVEPGPGRWVQRIKREKALDAAMLPRPVVPHAPRGLYLYGNVGCGKTLLMDMLFDAAEGAVGSRRRLHFHAAMLEVHQRMHRQWQQRRQRAQHRAEKAAEALRREGGEWEGEEEEEEEEEDWEEERLRVLDGVAQTFMGDPSQAYGASLLCFDEIQVVDVFTAVALAGLLGRLLERGAVLVATSNRAPSELNKDGLQKAIFEPFIRQLEAQCRPMLVGTTTDYRRVNAAAVPPESQSAHYLWPLDEGSQLELERQWEGLTQRERATQSHSQQPMGPIAIPVMFGRSLPVPESCGGVARFTFEDLCSRPVGAADYIALAQRYHTVVVTGIPAMSMKIRDQARRFITLVDELHNHRCRLLCTAEAPAEELFLGTEEGPLVDLESLQFETAVEGTRLRRDVLQEGGVAPVGASSNEKAAIESQLSGREEEFAFRRAVSRLIEMQTPSYLQSRGRM